MLRVSFTACSHSSTVCATPMDSIAHNSELAQEMARLLYNELQKARRELDELRSRRTISVCTQNQYTVLSQAF